jgi:hypothetical protein
MRSRVLLLAFLLSAPAPAAAEWQLRPFLGLTFGGTTTFVDPERAVDNVNVTFGGSAVLLGEVLGVEADVGYGPGFFQAGDQQLVRRSFVSTVTGNVVVAMPRRLSEYTLRPYFVTGYGVMRVRRSDELEALSVGRTLPALGIGGGVTGFLTDRLGVSWELRHFRSFGGTQLQGVSIAPERLSFWRATMAVAIRY